MLDKQIIHHICGQAGEVEPFAVVYSDRSRHEYGKGKPRFTVIFHDAHALDLRHGDLDTVFAEAYTEGKIDVDGDLADVVALAAKAYQLKDEFSSAKPSLTQGFMRAVHRSHKQQKQNIAHHYDLGNEFFKLWLDDSLTYSCAYFKTQDDTLEDAQKQKVDHVLRKLRLIRGQSLLDIGCGWGALILRAVEEYDVRALGITLSEEQMGGACAAIGAKDLNDKANVLLVHYEDLAREGRTYDRIASIGMIEHVGQAYLGNFARSVDRLLKPGGLALLHCITAPNGGPFNQWMDRHVFPGAYCPTVTELVQHYADQNLRILDVENLRPHYEMTLDHWSQRFEEHIEPITQMYGEEFVRMWRMYLRATAASFRVGTLEVHQILVSKGVSEDVPLTRSDLYSD